jgi:phospholipid transport system substrate-binding protein
MSPLIYTSTNQKIFQEDLGLRRTRPLPLVISCLAVLVGLLCFGGPAGASPDAETPTAVVHQLVESIKHLSTVQSTERPALLTKADHTLAITPLAKTSLGDTWETLSTEERESFVHLLIELFENAVYPRAGEFFSKIEVSYGDEETDGGNRVVHTSMTEADGGEVEVDYILVRDNGAWRIVDVNLDGESLAANVASQIQATLKRGSYEELVAKMQKKLKVAKEEPSITPQTGR